MESHSPSHRVPQGGARELKNITVPGPAVPSVPQTGKRAACLAPWSKTSENHVFELGCSTNRWFVCSPVEPVVRFNTWVSSDSSNPSLPIVCRPRLSEEQIYLEDVQTGEDKLNSSMLSSESTFIPFTSDLEPRSTHSDSEDETETFEPDSLAPKHPAQSKKQNANNPQHPPTVEQHERKTLEGEEVISATDSTSSGLLGVRVSTLQNDLDSDFVKAEVKEAQKQEEVESKSSVTEADRAAIKIQSWWRGHYTRCCHPMAREVRSEIRLRRMQEHILFLSEKLDQ